MVVLAPAAVVALPVTAPVLRVRRVLRPGAHDGLRLQPGPRSLSLAGLLVLVRGEPVETALGNEGLSGQPLHARRAPALLGSTGYLGGLDACRDGQLLVRGRGLHPRLRGVGERRSCGWAARKHHCLEHVRRQHPNALRLARELKNGRGPDGIKGLVLGHTEAPDPRVLHDLPQCHPAEVILERILTGMSNLLDCWSWLPGCLAAWLPGRLAAWLPGCHWLYGCLDVLLAGCHLLSGYM